MIILDVGVTQLSISTGSQPSLLYDRLQGIIFLVTKFHKVATVREKYLKMKYFPGQGKVREFCDGQGNLERTWKVSELKINGYCRQFSENLFCSRGERMFFEIV